MHQPVPYQATIFSPQSQLQCRGHEVYVFFCRDCKSCKENVTPIIIEIGLQNKKSEICSALGSREHFELVNSPERFWAAILNPFRSWRFRYYDLCIPLLHLRSHEWKFGIPRRCILKLI